MTLMHAYDDRAQISTARVRSAGEEKWAPPVRLAILGGVTVFSWLPVVAVGYAWSQTIG